MIVRTLKRAVKRTLASRSGWRVLGPVVREPGVIVLTYHRINGSDRRLDGISIEAFERHMKWVRERCNPIEPAEIRDYAGRARTSRPPVVVSFDDGYKDYRELAYPVLERLRIPAVVFIATSFMDEGGMVWTEQVQWAVRYARRDRVTLPWSDGAAFVLDGEQARSKLSGVIRAHLKKLPDAERRAILPALLAALDAPPLPERQMLDWDDVRAASALTRWGGHTHTHPILSRLTRADAEREIKTCRDRIAAETGTAPTLFAYPNGTPADYTPETQAILRENGFSIAFSTSEGIAGPDTDWMAVRRLPSGEFDVPDFVWTASGLMRA
jgi:peptidoglycan/xylan/chitin deacetylase (PgdA/CDA1 family)